MKSRKLSRFEKLVKNLEIGTMSFSLTSNKFVRYHNAVELFNAYLDKISVNAFYKGIRKRYKLRNKTPFLHPLRAENNACSFPMLTLPQKHVKVVICGKYKNLNKITKL